MSLFTGLAAFPITPADADGRVDAAALRRLVRRLADARVDGIGLLGSTGTYPFLSRAERRRAIEAAVDEAGGAVPVMAGVGALRTDEAVALAKDAKAAGAVAGLLAPVSYTPLLDEEVFVHFQTVAGESGLPICIYNNPGTTHFSFSLELMARLSAVPGVVGVKNGAPPAAEVAAHLAALRARVPAGFSVGYSGDVNATEAMIAGGDVWHSVLGGLMPAPLLAIVRAAQAGDAAEARRLNARLAPIWALFVEFTGLRVMYAAANALGITDAQPPRPILPLPEAAARKVAEAFLALSRDQTPAIR
ncbi:MAG TPA: dihydrodipicolinate synthase family protein [Caulobacteraceae bacterium]|jgi:4-hydroxy-tetrahydrodipicolinate synthase|nr:dihydrodipicolinate synthase family protein [Caulobacteraceae bacterium]